jgi:hypothetical protein
MINGLVPNRTILGLLAKLLDSPDYGVIASELKADSDIQLLLEYILYVRIPSSACWPSDLLPIATLSQWPIGFWHSRCQQKGQEANVQSDIYEKRHT